MRRWLKLKGEQWWVGEMVAQTVVAKCSALWQIDAA